MSSESRSNASLLLCHGVLRLWCSEQSALGALCEHSASPLHCADHSRDQRVLNVYACFWNLKSVPTVHAFISLVSIQLSGGTKTSAGSCFSPFFVAKVLNLWLKYLLNTFKLFLNVRFSNIISYVPFSEAKCMKHFTCQLKFRNLGAPPHRIFLSKSEPISKWKCSRESAANCINRRTRISRLRIIVLYTAFANKCASSLSRV